MVDLFFENSQELLPVEDEYVKICEKALNETLVFEGLDFDAEVNLIFTDDEEIREINLETREIDRATDVLSFPMIDGFKGKLNILEGDVVCGKVILGDIVISLERAKEQAENYGHSLFRELGFLAVHSMLHLLGYDHELSEEDEKEMFKKQEEILVSIGLTR